MNSNTSIILRKLTREMVLHNSPIKYNLIEHEQYY